MGADSFPSSAFHVSKSPLAILSELQKLVHSYLTTLFRCDGNSWQDGCVDVASWRV